MDVYQGQVSTVLLDEAGNKIGWLRCHDKVVPAPGRYVMAWRPIDLDAPLPIPLFASAYNDSGYLAVATGPLPWEPGDVLQLRGPLGRGFAIPSDVRRLALATFHGQMARLLPLIVDGLARGVAIALFMDGVFPQLPPAVEIHPLSAFQEGLSWADFLALELPLDMAPRIANIFGARKDSLYAGVPGQVLLLSDMPCGGLADCGVCSIKGNGKSIMVCKDGPVFEIGELVKLSA